jgi:DNA-binding transcriptional regulator YhcF (GntR family)
MESYYLCNTEIFGLSKSTVKIYSFLRMVRNTKTDNSFYGKRSIAVQCHVSISTVTRAIRELCAKGLLEVCKRFEEYGRQTSNHYILLDNLQTQIEPDRSNKSCKDMNVKKSNTPMLKSHPEGSQPTIRLFRCTPASLKADLAPSAVKVYSYFSFRAGKDGQCKPSKREIASDCRISVSTVTRAIRQLRNTGLISVISQTRQEVYGNNGKSVNLYILNRDVAAEKIKKEKPKSRCFWLLKVLILILLCLFDTLPHVTRDTPRTISRNKVTDNLRSKSILSELTKWYKRPQAVKRAGLGYDLAKNE